MSKPRLLYISCHPTMEYDEISTYLSLGFDVFSIGHYLNPECPVKAPRGKIDGFEKNDKLISMFNKLCPTYTPTEYEFELSKEFVDNFDVVVVTYSAEVLDINWPVLKNKIVIRRTIAQSNGPYEQKTKIYKDQGLKVVRYSKNEETLPGFVGSDAIIRTSTNPELYKNWRGDVSEVITVQKAMKKHSVATQFEAYNYITFPFKRKLIGFDNEDVPWALTDIPTKELKEFMKSAAVYFCPCTRPTSFTYSFQEALMTGIPVVTVGPSIGNHDYYTEGKMYEQHELIENGVSGFWSDDLNELRHYISELMNCRKLSDKVSKAGRERALELFHPDIIKSDWGDFFKSLGLL